MLPRRWRRALGQARRDASHILATLRGHGPAPFVEMSIPEVRTTVRRARIVEVLRETAQATTLRLAIEGDAPYRFQAGQFTTVQVTLDGTSHRRCYSFSSAPCDSRGDELTITIKRVADGTVSPWLVDHAAPGDVLTVSEASGRFVVGAELPRRLVLFAGGSGITPLFSILTDRLARVGERTPIALVDANRSWQQVIFRDQLAALSEAHPDRLTIKHVLERPGRKRGVQRGRLDADGTRAALDALAADSLGLDGAAFWVCGPGPMMDAVRGVLLERGVAAEHIHEERFFTIARSDESVTWRDQPMTLRHPGGDVHQAVVTAGQTLLEAGLGAGAPLPSSCTMGGCGACRVTLLDGDVLMDEPNCLTPEERAAGQVLSCVSRPLGPVTIEVVSR